MVVVHFRQIFYEFGLMLTTNLNGRQKFLDSDIYPTPSSSIDFDENWCP